MKYVILAAGKGTRLGIDLPKPLAKLACGQHLIGRQIESALQYFPPHDICIVVGHQKERFIQQFPECHFIENPGFENSNTAESLKIALEALKDDILWVNGDVVMKEGIIAHILSLGSSCVLVNEGPTGEEEVKYSLTSDGYIAEIGKEVKDSIGEALGVNFMLFEDVKTLSRALEECSTQDYFEKAMQLCIQVGMKLKPLKVGLDDCVEVDFPEDLERANTLVAKWSSSLPSY